MKVVYCFLILVLPTVSHAAVYGGSNLGFGGYPEFSESPPSPPYSDDEYAWDRYRRDVQSYSEKAKEYLEDSDSDIKRIKEAQEDAIQKANDAVEQYNRQVRQ